MKNLLYLLLFGLSLTLTNCSSDNEENNNTDSLIGVWKITDQDSGSGYVKIDIIPYANAFLFFGENDIFKSEGFFGNVTGKYTKSSLIITCTDNQGLNFAVYEILYLDSKTIELGVTQKNATYKIKGYKYSMELN